MNILFLHGRYSVPGGIKPSYLMEAGHQVLNPFLPCDSYPDSFQKAQNSYNSTRPDVIVGSSRGGAIAMNLAVQGTPLVLVCPSWKQWGTVSVVPVTTQILHARTDTDVPFADSEELAFNSQLPPGALIEVGRDHRMVDKEPLEALLAACLRAVEMRQSV